MTIDTRASPNFGPNVLIFDSSMPAETIQSQINAIYSIQQNAQFGAQRFALLFKPGDAYGLATAIERLVREPELVEKLGRNSRKAYEKYFTLERFGADFERLVR